MRVDDGPTLITERLVLRRWRPADIGPFAAMNADPVVMEYFPAALTEEQSNALAARADGLFDKHGIGLWAVEVGDAERFVGFVGLAPFFKEDPGPLPFAPGVEVGWRLARNAWGKGIATEAALAALEFGFIQAGLPAICSFTSVVNERSRAVMRRIGLHHDPADDFDHPRVPAAHTLRPHVLYKLSQLEWAEATSRPQ
jgi:RimJ/RimL family protein N-acetyltransferase